MCFDVTPLSLGWESYGEEMCVVILENMHIPVTMKMKCVITDDNHSSILIKVFQGERSRQIYCFSLLFFYFYSFTYFAFFLSMQKLRVPGSTRIKCNSGVGSCSWIK